MLVGLKVGKGEGIGDGGILGVADGNTVTVGAEVGAEVGASVGAPVALDFFTFGVFVPFFAAFGTTFRVATLLTFGALELFRFLSCRFATSPSAAAKETAHTLMMIRRKDFGFILT